MTKRFHNHFTKPTSVKDFYSEEHDLYDELSTDWQQKAERLQMRRWREIMKRQQI